MSPGATRVLKTMPQDDGVVGAGTILVYGPGPGLGKSTLGRAIVEEIALRGQPARFFAEDEALAHPAFRGYVEEVRAGRADNTAALLESCREFTVGLRGRSPEVAVLDSVLPCWDWLYGARCPEEEVVAFSRVMADLLAPLTPVIVFVDGDPEAALSRAIGDRGLDWALDLAELRTGRRDIDALGEYFRRLRAGAERMLARWPHRVVRVETVARDTRSCADEVLSAVGADPAG